MCHILYSVHCQCTILIILDLVRFPSVVGCQAASGWRNDFVEATGSVIFSSCLGRSPSVTIHPSPITRTPAVSVYNYAYVPPRVGRRGTDPTTHHPSTAGTPRVHPAAHTAAGGRAPRRPGGLCLLPRPGKSLRLCVGSVRPVLPSVCSVHTGMICVTVILCRTIPYHSHNSIRMSVIQVACRYF